jgi:hypothetical protein
VTAWHRVTNIVGVTYRLIVKFRALSLSHTLLLLQVVSHLVEVLFAVYETTYTTARCFTMPPVI